MDIGNALRRTDREAITTRAVIASITCEIYNHPLEIQSVQIRSNKVIIKT